MSTAAVATLADAPLAEPRRPRVLFVGAAFAAVASAVTIATLLATYLTERAHVLAEGGTALPEGIVLPLTPGNMVLGTLGMSLFTISWVVYALRNGDRSHAYFALALTLIFGAASINATVYLYQQLEMGLTASSTATLLYAVTGAHLLMIVAAMLFAAVMGFQALGGQLTGRDAEGMSAAALYWYVTVVVYAVVWYAVYITK